MTYVAVNGYRGRKNRESPTSLRVKSLLDRSDEARSRWGELTRALHRSPRTDSKIVLEFIQGKKDLQWAVMRLSYHRDQWGPACRSLRAVVYDRRYHASLSGVHFRARVRAAGVVKSALVWKLYRGVLLRCWKNCFVSIARLPSPERNVRATNRAE